MFRFIYQLSKDVVSLPRLPKSEPPACTVSLHCLTEVVILGVVRIIRKLELQITCCQARDYKRKQACQS